MAAVKLENEAPPFQDVQKDNNRYLYSKRINKSSGYKPSFPKDINDLLESGHKMSLALKAIPTLLVFAVTASSLFLASASLLVQSVNATDVITGATGGGGEEEGATTSGNITTNSDSNVTLGDLFHIGQTIEETFNPINETYFVLTYVDRVTLMPPNAATDVVINATERGNFTVNILPNGLSMNQGHGLITTEGDGGQEETATTTFASLGRTDAEGTTGSVTGVIFFSTNSTGQLASLDNMVGIAQLEFTPEESTIKVWEWKGGIVPFGNGGGVSQDDG